MDRGEVICISSDDEAETEQSSIRIGQQPKPSASNVSVITKAEPSWNNAEENGIAKRKPESDGGGAKKKVKLNEKTGELTCVSGRSSSDSECTPINDEEKAEEEEKKKEKEEEKAREKEMLKPKLVVKERRTITQVEQDTFPMFISLCLQRDRSEEMLTIVNKLKRRYEQLDPKYTNSEEFRNFLNQKRNEIMDGNSKYLYSPIREVMMEMKNSSRGMSKLLLNRTNRKSKVPSSSDCTENGDAHYDSGECEEDDEKSKRVKKQIRKLLKAMDKCQKYIKKFEESEMDFDEDNNSNYIKAERYKERMMELYYKYCELSGEHADTGRPYLRPKHLNATGIIAVDQAINSFINSKISMQHKMKKVGAFADALIFPDYRDILQCIEKCNESHNLGLSAKKQQQIAKTAFVQLGEHLQRVRRNDYWDTFSLYLENSEEDPALKDASLCERLNDNRREGDKKLKNVFQEYVKKQEQMKEDVADEEEESVQDDEEEEEEEKDEEEVGDEVDLEASESDEHMSMDTDEDEPSASKDETTNDKTDVNDNRDVAQDKNDDEIVEISEISEKDKSRVTAKDKSRPSKESISEESTSKNGSSSITESKTGSERETKRNSALEKTVPSEKPTSPEKVLITASDAVKENISESVDEDKEKDTGPTEDKPPLLRVRSFAKTPSIWKEEQKKDANGMPMVNQAQKQSNNSGKTVRTQLGTTLIPLQGKARLVLPPGTKVIKIKTLTEKGGKPRNQIQNAPLKLNASPVTVHQVIDVAGDDDVVETRPVTSDKQTVTSKTVDGHKRVQPTKPVKTGNIVLTGPRSLLPNR